MSSREGRGCVACGCGTLTREWTVISPFFAERALLRTPEVIALCKCSACGSKFFGVDATEEQLARLYRDYRAEAYFEQRHRFEPWYTKAVNDGTGSEAEMDRRRRAMLGALARAGIGTRFEQVLDHGGDRGQMLRGLNAVRKAVYEISGTACEPGVDAVSIQEMSEQRWDLVLSCHVLEHLMYPRAFAQSLAALGGDNAVYFFEVPHESIRSTVLNSAGVQRRWLQFACKRPRLLERLDYLSEGALYRLGFVPPLLFFALREHLTFFTEQGLRALVSETGLSVLSVNLLETGHLGLIAVKR